MADHKQEEDRWRELADLLGLPENASGQAKPAPPPEPAAAPEAPAIKAYEEPRTLPVIAAPLEEETSRLEEQDAPTIPMLREEPAPGWEDEFDDEENDTPLDEEPAAGAGEPAPANEGQAEPVAPAGEEEQPRRGRRRRRRGRRRGGDRAEGDVPERGPPAQEAPKTPRPPRAGEPDPRDRQGHGRRPDVDDRRRSSPPRPEPAAPAAQAEEFHDEPPVRTHAVPASDTDFSDWNVPSWQDLISALHRPDR